MENIIAKYVVDSTDWDRVAEKMGFVLAKEEQLQKATTQTAATVKRTARETDGAAASTGKLSDRIRDANGRFIKLGQDGTAATKKIKDGTDATTGGIGNLSNMLGNLKGQIIGAFSVAAVLAFGKSVVDATVKNEAMGVSLAVMLKSKQQANVLMGQIAAFAASTPFELTELNDATKKLLAFGFSASEVIPTLTNLGNIAAGIGIPITELAELYGKARVQGRLFAEDVNQLTGRGIPVIQEFAKQFGVTDGEVKKLVESGKIGFKELETAIISLNSAGNDVSFFGLMEKQSETLGGGISNLSDKFTAFFVTLGRGNSGVMKETVSWLGKLVDRVNVAMADVSDLATEAAGQKLTDYNSTIKPIIEKTIEETEKAGGDVDANLARLTANWERSAKKRLEIAQKELAEAQKKYDQRGVGDNSPQLKKDLIDAAAAVEVYKGQLGAIKPSIEEVKKARIKAAAEATAAEKLAGDKRKVELDKEIKKANQLREAYNRLVKDLQANARESQLDLKEAILGEGDPGILEARAKLAKDKLIAQFAEAREKIKEAGAAAGVSEAQVNVKLRFLDSDLQNQLKTINANTAAALNELAEKTNAQRVANNIKGSEQAETIEATARQNRQTREMQDLLALAQNKIISVEEYEARKQEIEEQYRKEALEAELKYINNQLRFKNLSIDQRTALEAKAAQTQAELGQLEVDAFEEKEKQKTKTAAEEAAERQKIEQLAYEAGAMLGNAMFEMRQQNLAAELEQNRLVKDAELVLAGDNAAKVSEINQAFAIKERDLKIKQAKADKEQALFNIGIQTAMGIMRTVAEVPKFDFGISTALLVGLYAAMGLTQAAVVMSKPLPKFKDGTSFVEGPGTETSDSIHALLSRGERVTKASVNRRYFGTLEAIHAESIPAEILNEAVSHYLKFGDFKGPKIDVDGKGVKYDTSQKVVEAINGLPERMPKTDINLDANGFSASVTAGQQRRTDLANRYSH